MSKYMVITNNVRSRLDDTHEVIYLELSYEELLKVVRDRIYEGHRLLTHPLSGSVKPKETPYKSVLISERKEKVDGESVRLIENAILVCQKFQDKSKYYKEEVYKDFQLVDWTLLESGLASADVW
jgi:hypothetical protein